LLSTRVSLTSVPGQFHDFFSGDSARAAPAHMLDQGVSALALARRGGPLDPDGVPIQLEFNLGIGQKAELPSYRERNGDLAFARDSQVVLLLVRVLPWPGVRQCQKRSDAANAGTVNAIRPEYRPNARR
jgi:hypothetical protein